MTKQLKTTGTRSKIWWCNVSRSPSNIVADLTLYYDEYSENDHFCDRFPSPICWMKSTVITSSLVKVLIDQMD